MVRYTDDEIISLLWLFKQSNYSPEVPGELLLTIEKETGHSISSLRLYLINIESTHSSSQISSGLRPLSQGGMKHYKNYIGSNATGNIDKDGPKAYKAITGEDADFSQPNFISMDEEDFLNYLEEEDPRKVFSLLFDEEEFNDFLKNVNQKYLTVFDNGRIKTFNSAGKARSAWLEDLWKAFYYLRENYDLFEKTIQNHKEFNNDDHLIYAEAPYRVAYDKTLPLEEFDEIYSWAVEQTPSFTETLSKIIGFINKRSDCSIRDPLLLSFQNLNDVVNNVVFLEEEEELNLENFKQVVLQPCSNKIAQENFNISIAEQYDINELKKQLKSKEYKELIKIGPFHGIWGIVNVPKKTWERLEEGALVLFFANKKAFAACTLTKKFINKKLGEYLWEKTATGESYKYIYTVNQPISIDLPQSFINRNLGYKENFVVQGFQVIDEQKSSVLISAIKQLYRQDSSKTQRGSGWSNCNDCGITVMVEELKNGICPSC